MTDPFLGLRCADRGRVDRHLVVLVHGTMDRAQSFARTIRRLDDLDVVAIDRRGYGESARLEATADLSRHVADIASVTDHRRCVMIGHSFGGLVALSAAAEGVANIAAVGAYEPPAAWLTGDHRSSLGTDDSRAAAEAFMISQIGAAAWGRIGERTRDKRRSEGPALLADLAMAELGTPFDPGDVLVPVSLARGGTGSRFVASTDALADALPDARLFDFEGVGHGAHLSSPDAFASWIVGVVELAERLG